MSKVLYLIGSLRNDRIPKLANRLRQEFAESAIDCEVFEDWFSAGYEADDWWKTYERGRGRSYAEALDGYAANHVFNFDKTHLDRCTHALLVLPAGKSGHMEVTYAKYGAGAQAAILLDPADDPRWDLMYKFIDRVIESDGDIGEWINERTPVQEILTFEEAERRGVSGLVGGRSQSATRRQDKARNASRGRLAGLLSERFGGDRETLETSW